MRKYFEIEAKIKLYRVEIGRKSFITNGYRPHIYFGYSTPTNSSFSSDTIITLNGLNKLNPGETAFVTIWVLNFEHLKLLLEENVLLKIKEGTKFIGEGVITKKIGEKILK
jgi:translation elongation factor EF-Tu-like GTPase